jgi:hypothetical protein
MLPKRSAHHVLAEMGPADAERTIVLMAHHDAAHTAFFFNPAITEAVGENAPWVFEDNDTSPPLMWPTVAGPAVVAAGAALGSRKLTGLGTFLSAASAAFMAHIGVGEVVPGANDNGTGCIAQLAIARALAERPPRTRGSSSSPPRRRSLRGWDCSWSGTQPSCRLTGPSSSVSTRSARPTSWFCEASEC